MLPESVKSRQNNNNSDDKKSSTTGQINNGGGKTTAGNTFLDISTTAAASFGAEHAFKFTTATEDNYQRPIA